MLQNDVPLKMRGLISGIVELTRAELKEELGDFLEHTQQGDPAVESLGVRLTFLSANEGYKRRKKSAHIWTC
jgi:hypothetical protein